MKNQGFTLIEIVVAVALSAMVSVMLYTALDQLKKTVTRSVSALSFQRLEAVLYHELDKDFLGVCALTKKPFIVQRTDNQLNLSFVSTNILHVYSDKKTHDTPHIARVKYRLKKQGDTEFFMLERAEIKELDADKEKESELTWYTMMRFIKKFDVTLVVLSDKEQKEPESRTSWGGDKGGDAKEKSEEGPLPKAVRVDGVWYDDRLRRDMSFEWYFDIPSAEAAYAARKESQKKEQKKSEKPQQKPPQRTSMLQHFGPRVNLVLPPSMKVT